MQCRIAECSILFTYVLVDCLISQQTSKVYLRDGSTEIIRRATTLREKSNVLSHPATVYECECSSVSIHICI